MGKEVVLVLSSPFHPDSTIPFGWGGGGSQACFFFFPFSQIRISALQGQTASLHRVFQSPCFVRALNINIRINSYGNTMKVFLW